LAIGAFNDCDAHHRAHRARREVFHAMVADDAVEIRPVDDDPGADSAACAS